MNIFFLHINMKKNASYYFNKHMKIILEITQMCYSAHHILQPNYTWLCTIPFIPYKKTHPNHPMVKWICYNENNYKYACEFGLVLCQEYTKRFKKIYKCQQYLEWLLINIPPCKPVKYSPDTFLATENIPLNCTPVPLCMPDEYKSNDLIKSYRLYMINAKKHLCDEKTLNYLIEEWK